MVLEVENRKRFGNKILHILTVRFADRHINRVQAVAKTICSWRILIDQAGDFLVPSTRMNNLS